jgi:transcriptional regulator with XRE-family HTH domain
VQYIAHSLSCFVFVCNILLNIFLIELYEVSCGTTTRQSKCASLSKFKGLSQQQLADLAGLSRRMVAGVESGQDNISLAKLSLIADVLEVDFVQIIAAPEQQGQAVVNVLAWQGTQAHSEAKLMASAAATQKVELWTWVLAPNEHYSAEPDPVGWREMLYVMEGS